MSQRINMFITCYKNDDFATATYRTLRGDYEMKMVGLQILKGLCIIASLVPLTILLL